MGLLEAVGATDGGVVPAPPYRDGWHPGAGVRHAREIAKYSGGLADRLQPLLAEGRFPVVLGGDCSILLGSMLALRRLGRYGLVFIDGHLDYRHPGNAEFVGAAAGEDLALVTGRGQADLADLEGRRPLVRDGDVVALGFREGPVEAEAEDILDTEITLVPLESVRERGARQAAGKAVEGLALRGVAGAWVHVDVDVIDSELMPAVDSPAPGGLNWVEFEEVLAELFASPLAVGAEFTIFDPDLDPDGQLARRLVRSISHALVAGANTAAEPCREQC